MVSLPPLQRPESLRVLAAQGAFDACICLHSTIHASLRAGRQSSGTRDSIAKGGEGYLKDVRLSHQGHALPTIFMLTWEYSNLQWPHMTDRACVFSLFQLYSIARIGICSPNASAPGRLSGHDAILLLQITYSTLPRRDCPFRDHQSLPPHLITT